MNRPFLRNRHRLASLALLGALTFGSGCSGKDEPAQAKQDAPQPADSPTSESAKAPAPRGPVANPSDSPAIAEVGDVVATVQLPTGINMSDIAALIDSIQPGGSVLLKMTLPDTLKAAVGFDISKSAKLDAALSFIILNPASHPQPLALLVEASDAAKLAEDAKGAGHAIVQRGDLVLIGPETVVNAAKEFAFNHLTKHPDHSEIIIYPKLLLSSFAGQLEQGMAASAALLGNESAAQIISKYFEAMVSIGEQSERIVLSVAGGSGSADLIARIYPVAGGSLASFVEAQQPSQHSLLSKLPDSGRMVVISGDLRAGAARDALMNFSVDAMASMYNSLSADEWKTMLTPWLDNLDGSFAASVALGDGGPGGPMAIRSLMSVNDSEAMRASWRAMLAKMAQGGAAEMMGMKVEWSHTPDVFTHDGVAIDLHRTKIDASGLPPAQAAIIQSTGSEDSMHLATFDKFAAMTTAEADAASMRAMIDAARGKGVEPHGQLATVVEASKQRGDSMLVFFDVGAMLAGNAPSSNSPPFTAMSWAMGKHAGALSLRLSFLE